MGLGLPQQRSEQQHQRGRAVARQRLQLGGGIRDDLRDRVGQRERLQHRVAGRRDHHLVRRGQRAHEAVVAQRPEGRRQSGLEGGGDGAGAAQEGHAAAQPAVGCQQGRANAPSRSGQPAAGGAILDPPPPSQGAPRRGDCDVLLL